MVHSTNEEFTILGDDPRFNLGQQVIRVDVNLVRLPIFQRPIDVEACGTLSR